jgi:polyferredoxin
MIGIAYGILFIFIGAFLWRTGRFSRPVKFILLLVTILMGFAVFSPMIPHNFQQLILRSDAYVGFALVGAAAGMAVFFLLTFLFGRHFCGYLCPIGAVQELAYEAPTPKVRLPWKVGLSVIRGLVFVIIIGTGLGLSLSILSFFGIEDFFRLTFSLGFFVFLVLIAISLFIYRPFCRLICPVAVIFQFFATPARWKIRRTDACIECRKCERVCPTNEAGRTDKKSECYLCRRCIEVCPVKGALLYSGRGEPKREEEKGLV